MSLVAYGASDDSETSDVEEPETSQPTESGEADDRAFADDGKISDEDDYVPTTARIHSASSSSSQANNVVVTSTKEIEFNPVAYAPSTLSDLPAPKASSSAKGGEDGEDELEEEVKPKASQLADAPKPPPKKVKQPARIVLPALKKDSDDEEDDSQKKPKKQPVPSGASGSRSGLFSLLPAPTHTSRKQANRPLIPYTLTKRPTAAKPTPPTSTTTTTTAARTADPPSQKHQSAFNALTGYESDSDEEEGGGGVSANFFSIGNEAEGATTSGSSGMSVVKNSAPRLEHKAESSVRTSGVKAAASGDLTNAPSAASHSSLAPKPVSTALESSVSSSSGVPTSTSQDSSTISSAAKTEDSSQQSDGEGDASGDDDENEVSSTVGIPLVDQDAPLTFSSAMQSRGWSTAPLTSPMFPEMYAAPLGGGATSYWQRQEHYAQDHNAQEEQEASSSGSHDLQNYMEDEQFLRLSGKRKRGQEDIQIIDANVDDCVDPSELMKGISEESSYQPHRKKENMPSMQQKRKKQITYLAFQAKERELELKNAWSQNRMTKNQARSKYGF